MQAMIKVRGLTKRFTLHNQGGVVINVFDGIDFTANAGQCSVLYGESGSGKSTLLRSLYANYLPTSGDIFVRHRNEWIELTGSNGQKLLEIRRESIGYVSQFLRVIPRVSTLDVVKQPLKERGICDADATEQASLLLQRLHISERLWALPPGTFSGGEQQRVNIARGFIADYPILLLDEPTASLDKGNSRVVVELIREALARDVAIVGIFHDVDVREAVADTIFHVNPHIKSSIDNLQKRVQA